MWQICPHLIGKYKIRLVKLLCYKRAIIPIVPHKDLVIHLIQLCPHLQLLLLKFYHHQQASESLDFHLVGMKIQTFINPVLDTHDSSGDQGNLGVL